MRRYESRMVMAREVHRWGECACSCDARRGHDQKKCARVSRWSSGGVEWAATRRGVGNQVDVGLPPNAARSGNRTRTSMGSQEATRGREAVHL